MMLRMAVTSVHRNAAAGYRCGAMVNISAAIATHAADTQMQARAIRRRMRAAFTVLPSPAGAAAPHAPATAPPATLPPPGPAPPPQQPAAAPAPSPAYAPPPPSGAPAPTPPQPARPAAPAPGRSRRAARPLGQHRVHAGGAYVLVLAKLADQLGADLMKPGNQPVNVLDRLMAGPDRLGAALSQRRDRRAAWSGRLRITEVLPGTHAEIDQAGQLLQPGRRVVPYGCHHGPFLLVRFGSSPPRRSLTAGRRSHVGASSSQGWPAAMRSTVVRAMPVRTCTRCLVTPAARAARMISSRLA